MKKADVILGASVIAAGILLFSVRSFFQKGGAFVTVEKDGEFYGSYSMAEDQEISIDGENCITIQDQTVWMNFSSCPDHLCEHQGTIRSDGEMIVCLPNRVIVQVQAEKTIPEKISKEDEIQAGDEMQTRDKTQADRPDVIAN